MIRSFGDETTEDVYHGRATKRARRLPRHLWPIIRRKLDMLNAAHELPDLRQPPGNRLERLRAVRPGRYSIRVNDQYRIPFEFEGGQAGDVVCEDYHR